MARPKINIKDRITDVSLVEGLAKLHCSDQEIATVCNISVDTLHRNFAEVITKGKANGRIKLRRAQWQNAEKGNVVMQIWLGKQILGQREPKDMDQNPAEEQEDKLMEELEQRSKENGT